MKQKIIYHGSKYIIEKPIFGYGKTYNDYGLGFYCTEDASLAKEWAVSKDCNGIVNEYCLNTDGLRVMNLCADQYSILHWLAILVDNRTFDIQTDFGKEAKYYLLERFLPDYMECDLMIGYRADDSYFSFAQDFLNNAISLRTLARAMVLGHLGEQVVLKSEKAFGHISHVSHEVVNHLEWYPKKERRETCAREHYANMRSEKWRRGELYMMQILDEEIKADDARLRPDIIIESQNISGVDV